MLKLLTVTELNMYLGALIDSDPILPDLWVEGEVFDFRPAQSGHWYFKLRHGDASISVACWRSSVARISTRPTNGERVLAHGKVGYYANSGQLQLYIDALKPAGVGILHAQFERLREQLAVEGLFEESRKRPLPAQPRRIGIVTSPTGAALQDILNVIRRRYPLTQALIAPCAVQGNGAAETIVEALYRLYETDVDVIIVARGGGSMEDLWAFNEEIVARAVFASPVPVVSGVGHETDITIIDYVADLRAPTPSAAAEVVTPTVATLLDAVAATRTRLENALVYRLVTERQTLSSLVRKLGQHTPTARILRDRQRIDEFLRRASSAHHHAATLRRTRLDGARARLAALSPLATLARGYAVVQQTDGTLVTAPKHVPPGSTLRITLRGGTVQVKG